MRYFYNSWDPAYKSHFGAIARNQSCQFTICLPEETPLDFSPVLVVFRTGFHGQIPFRKSCHSYLTVGVSMRLYISAEWVKQRTEDHQANTLMD